MSELYVKKKIPVEVYKLGEEAPQWFNDALNSGVIKKEVAEEDEMDSIDYYVIQTMEGETIAVEGEDYIAKGVEGELYPIKITIFNKTYEKYEETI